MRRCIRRCARYNFARAFSGVSPLTVSDLADAHHPSWVRRYSIGSSHLLLIGLTHRNQAVLADAHQATGRFDL